jgi:hypothetical protein
MTLLSIVQAAAVSLGLPEPAAVVTSTDPATKKLLGYANQAGRELARYHDWQGLIVEMDFPALAQQEQTNALPPADYDRMIYNAIVWDTTAHIQLSGPTPQRYWRLIKAGISSGVSGYWRILGNQLNILPILTADHIISFEYISKRWVLSANGAEQAGFESDTDTCKVPIFEDLLELEIVWRFRQSRGFAQYAEDMATCEREKEKAASSDRGTGRIRKEGDHYANNPQYPYFAGFVGS